MRQTTRGAQQGGESHASGVGTMVDTKQDVRLDQTKGFGRSAMSIMVVSKQAPLTAQRRTLGCLGQISIQARESTSGTK